MEDGTTGPSRSRDSTRRAFYEGGRPSDAVRAIHRRFIRGPLPRVLPIAAVLEVRGRTSGRTISVPLAVVRYRGAWYAASMLETTSNWVQNVRAAGGAGRLLHGRWRDVSLVEVPVGDRAPILRRYLQWAWSARAHFSIDWRSPLSEYERVAGLHPVFRIDPRQGTASGH